ncbi:MAG: hypothetical protein P8013_10865 [Candidatus Sulfobium sp.]
MASAVLAAVVISLTVFVYLYFASLKKDLLTVLSARAAEAIGQPVSIADISCRFPGSITAYDIIVGNPRGFAPGRLLRIKKVTVNMKLGELFSRRFYFNSIGVDSPEVTVIRNEEDKFNVSDIMRQFLSGGSSGAGYRIDALNITSGIFSINADDRMTARKVDVVIRNLSSSPKSRTVIKGGLMYAGNRMRLSGWAYLKADPGRFGINVSATDFSPPWSGEGLNKYGIDTGKAVLDMDVRAERYAGKGIEIKTSLRVKKARVAGFPSAGDIALTSDSLLDIGAGTLAVRDLSLRAGKDSEARLKGVITGLQKNPAYTAGLKIEKFDLSALHLAGIKLAGALTSGDLRMKGQLGGSFPAVSGRLFLRDASVTSETFVAGRIDARVIMSSSRGFSFRAESTANVMVPGRNGLEKPAGLRLSLSGRGRPGKMALSSSVTTGPVKMTIQGKAVHAGGVRLDSEGLLKNKRFSGREELEIKDLTVGGRAMGSFVLHSHAQLDKDVFELKGLTVKNERMTAGAKTVEVRSLGGKSGRRIDIEDLTADYPAGPAGLIHLNLSLDVRDGKSPPSGSFDVSAERISYRNIVGGPLEGGGRFNDKTFDVDLHRVKLFGGNLKCSLEGGIKEGYFPLLVKMDAEKIGLAGVSGALSEFVKLPYRLSGGTGMFSFEGAFHSAEDVTGKASFRLSSLSASRRSDGKGLLTGADLSGDIVFAGRDLDFKAGARVGNVAARARGGMEDFTGAGRKAGISIDVPKVRAADIRDAFWDIFPDAFLYAGLDGSLSASLTAELSGGGLDLDGGVSLRGFVLTGENGKYSVGPINGTIPLTYRRAGKYPGDALPVFDKSGFSRLRRYYEKRQATDDFSIINAGSFSYGFKLLDDIEVTVKPENGFLNIGKVSANIFGGKLEGSAVLGLPGGLRYTAGFIVDGLSLTKLCDNIGPIRGYISGKVDGVAEVKGSGAGISGLIGKADFWAYSTEGEKTMISKEFLRKVGGPAMRAYLGDRRFDKGIMDLYIQKGFLIFKDLDISHTNFLGVRDLAIRVAPFNNRIRLKDLLWSITEAAQRAKKE